MEGSESSFPGRILDSSSKQSAAASERLVTTEAVKVERLPEKEFAEPVSAAGGFSLVKWMISISNSNKLVKLFEAFFKWEGEAVSRHSVVVLLVSLVVVGLGCAGLPLLHEENNAIRLWIPQSSDFAVNYAWLWSTYPPEFREHSVIIHGDNVLTPEAVQKMYRILKGVYNIKTEIHNKTWEDTCFRRPVLKISAEMFEDSRKKRSAAGSPSSDRRGRSSDRRRSRSANRRKREAFGDDEDYEDPFGDFASFEDDLSVPVDYSIDQYPEPYCDIVEALPTACFHETILELWASEGEFNERSDSMIAELTSSQIVDKVNKWGYSELYLTENDFLPLLSGLTKDADGLVVGAQATTMKFMGRMNATLAMAEGGSDDAGTGELVDGTTAEFENALSALLLESNSWEPTNIQVEVNVANSFNQIASATIMTDVTNLIIGFSIVFVYVNFMLGRFNLVEQRAFISLMGLASVGMALFFSYGVCSMFGLFYGPLHNIIPFLLLGIGIDDMFVTVQCFQNLPPELKGSSLHVRMGETMLRAGSAITITSLTDFLAFIIGGTTVLPALRSFCIYCAVGIIVVYVLQATWFFAWFSLDQRRIEANRNGSIPCFVHKNYTPNSFSQKNVLETVFKKLGNIIMIPSVKILILLSTLGLFGVSVWGNILLRQEFNPIWFLPPDSYLAQWHQYNAKFFPSSGEKVTVFLGDLQLPEELGKLEQIHSELEAQTDTIVNIDSWYLGFKQYVDLNFQEDGPVVDMSSEMFNERLVQYLFSPLGSQYRFLFHFNDTLRCGQPSPAPLLTMLRFQHVLMSGPEEQIPAMNKAKAVFRDANFSGTVFPMAQGYASWETDEVIGYELYRNMSLAVLCIFFTTWILLFNLWACLQVLFSVVLTLVNVAGFMHFWGLTVDTVSCTNLIIAIGLCVDYSAHIAHSFMMCTGSREKRVKDALYKIGPAVLNGGFSTFLAFVLLATSRSHVFMVFFKVFFLVVLFGLFNGLIILPILLSIMGPRSYNHEEAKEAMGEGEMEEIAPLNQKVLDSPQPNGRESESRGSQRT